MKLFDRKIIMLALAASVIGPVAAAPENGKFRVNGAYLFNTTSEADNRDADFEGDNGLAGYIGYRVLPWLSLELGGLQFKPIDSSTSTTDANQQVEHEVTGYTAGVRGETTFAALFDIWFAAGVHSWDSTLNYEITYPNFPGLVRTGSDSHSGEGLYYRVGINLPITDIFKVSVESASFQLNDFFSNPEEGANTDLEQRYIGLGFEYSF